MRPIIFLAFLIIFVSSPVAGIGNTCPPIPFVPESGGAGMARLNEWCKSVGGTPSNSGGNWSCVNCPASGTSTGTSTANPYEGLFGWLFSIDANAKIRAQRKAALIRQLEYDRQDAIRRQQTVQAEKLNTILQRLMSGDMALKGFGGANDLQLKLGSEPILFQEYMSTPATSTTSAMLTLKTGDDASPSPQSQPVRSAEAATTTATTTSANIAAQPQLSPELKAIAEELSKLSPEQQQKLLEAIKSSETQAAANTTVATSSPEKAADTQLSFKLTETKTAADTLNAAANAPTNVEDIKAQSDKQFDGLKNVTANPVSVEKPTNQPGSIAKVSESQAMTATQTQTDSRPSPPTVETKPVIKPKPIDAGNTVNAEAERIRARNAEIAELDRRINSLRNQIEMDRRQLDRYRTQLTSLHSDIEAMANDAEQAREEGQMAAIDKAIGIQLDAVAASMSARELVTRGKLQEVKDLLLRQGVRPNDVEKILKGWFTSEASAESIRSTKELVEQLGTLRDVAAAYDLTTKKQYNEALAGCLGILVKSPSLKLLVTNVEIYSNLVYTGLNYMETRNRVDQYSELSEEQLNAIAMISSLYQRHVRELSQLTKKRQELGK